eukprot:4345887-Pleurochrysis_carterae.AAC.1
MSSVLTAACALVASCSSGHAWPSSTSRAALVALLAKCLERPRIECRLTTASARAHRGCC